MRRLRLFLIVLLGVAGGLVLAEAAFRTWLEPRERPRNPITSDPVLHHRLKPNFTTRVGGAAFTTNSLGLRDREYAVPKPPATFRILMLGDSFTAGDGLALEDTVPKRVEAMLRARCGAGWEVVNAGVASYSPILEYLLLRRVGLALEPDLVVLNFDMTDVFDDFVRTAIARLDPSGLPLAVLSARRPEAAILLPPLPKPPFLRFLEPAEAALNRLALYQALRQSWLGERLVGGLTLTPERLEARGLVGTVPHDRLAITRDGDFPGVRDAWRLTERYLGAIHETARARGLGFALVAYPHAHQVSERESPEGRRKIGIGSGLFTSERPFTILEDLGRRRGFPVLNLLRLFRERAAAAGPLFRRDDIHHTPRGARVFAEGVFEGLRDRGLVPCRPA